MTRRFAVALLALLVGGCSGSASRTPLPVPPTGGKDVTAIIGATVITMEPKLEAGARLAEQTVLVRGGHIVVVGPSSRVRVPEGARAIDARGKVLLPGLVDAHVHLVHAAHLPLYVARGVTTVRNMWGAPVHLAWRRDIEEGRRLGPTIRTAGPIVDGEDPVHDGSFVARTPDDADRAVALHASVGYDFVKAYTKLEPAVFERLVVKARAAGLKVVGHVPREVGLLRALDAGLFTVEHTNTFYDALQADDSPVKGKTDRASRKLWVDHLDTGKLGAVADHFSASGAFACPTRVVMHGWEPQRDQLARLARPEVKRFMLPSELAVWAPSAEPPEEQTRNAREIEVADAIVRELHRRGVGIIAGTDVGNPHVVPGYALHDEIAELARIGLGPYAALRAATHDAAVALGMDEEIGTVAIGKRADLVLVEGDPLRDIRATSRIAGVMVRGAWIDAPSGRRLLAEVERWTRGEDDPFAARGDLGDPTAPPLFRARYRVSWKDVPFDMERIVIRAGDDGDVVSAEAYDPHRGEWKQMSSVQAPGGGARAVTLSADGVTGTGRVEITRPEPGRLHVEGTLLSGDHVSTDMPIDPAAFLAVDRFLAGLALLPVEASRELKVVSLALGSTVEATSETWTVRSDDGGRRVEIATGKGAPRVLGRDASGFPSSLTTTAHGAKLEWKIVP